MIKNKYKIFFLLFILVAAGCAKNEHLRYPAKRWQMDNDRLPIEKPNVKRSYQLLDEAERQIYEQIQGASNITYAIQPSRFLTLSGKQPALNVNNFDEVPDSTWFTNHLGKYDLSIEHIVKHANPANAPDLNGEFLVKGAEVVGDVTWLLVKDVKERHFLFKFHNSATISKDIVALTILRLAGYNVPEIYYVKIKPDQLVLEPNATHRNKYGDLKALSKREFQQIKENIYHGQAIAAMAITSLKGEILGPFRFSGRRYGDFNDRVPHQHRRELRALSIFFALLNVRTPIEENTMDTFIFTDEQKGYLKHYLFNVQSRIDDEAEFDPAKWRSAYPNAAFLFITDQDAFWAAKIIMKLTDEKIDAIVKLSKFANPDVAQLVAGNLKERRDKIGRYWFQQVNPLDNFTINKVQDEQQIIFDDLAVKLGFYKEQDVCYRYRLQSQFNRIKFTAWQATEVSQAKLNNQLLAGLKEKKIYVLRIQTKRKAKQWWSESVDLFIKKQGHNIKILGLERKQ